VAAPRTAATAHLAVGGRLRSATAVELLTGNATANQNPILKQVGFMDRVLTAHQKCHGRRGAHLTVRILYGLHMIVSYPATDTFLTRSAHRLSLEGSFGKAAF